MFSGATTAELVITGTGFSTDPTQNRVTLDASPCDITAASATSITCLVKDDTPGGTRELGVYVANLGYAAPHAQEVQVSAAFVQSVTPTVLHANGAATDTTYTMVTVQAKVRMLCAALCFLT